MYPVFPVEDIACFSNVAEFEELNRRVCQSATNWWCSLLQQKTIAHLLLSLLTWHGSMNMVKVHHSRTMFKCNLCFVL